MNKTKNTQVSQNEKIIKLFNGLAVICKNKGMSKIRVSEITEIAEVHRSTFYRLFENKSDLIQRGSEIFWDNILHNVEKKRLGNKEQISPKKVPDYLIYLVKEVKKNSIIFSSFLAKNGSEIFRNITENRVKAFLYDKRLVNIEDIGKKELTAQMITACLIVLIKNISDYSESDHTKYLENYYLFVCNGIFKDSTSN